MAEYDPSKTIKVLDQNDKKSKDTRARVRAGCLHQRNGEAKLKNVQAKAEPGGLHYSCLLCGEALNLTRMELEEVQRAVAIVKAAINLTKLSIDTRQEKDIKIGKKLGKVLYHLEHLVLPAYESATKRGYKDRGDRRDSSERGGFWGNPRVQ